MPDGTNITTLEDLQKHIKNNDDVKKLVEYFLDGRLEKWLLDRYYEEEAKALQTVDKDDPDFTCKLCKAIGADYTPVGSVNIELIEYEKRMRKALEEVTLDSELIANAGCTASTQSELVFLLKNGKSTIYLWGDSFKLFVVKNISYIGILGKPSVDIGLPDLEAVESYGIKLENVKLPERFNSNPFKNANVGDVVNFGNYPQTSNGDIQPIEWQVLSKENNKMLVISKYGLDRKLFDSVSNNWANSEIRKWLNGEFYNKAFNDKEKKSIKSSNLSDVGTSDNVFLLSKEEAEKYFANNDARLCKATDYAVKSGARVADNGYSIWWLRSPNLSNSDYVCSVLGGGLIYNFDVYYGDYLVRPALWINIGNTFDNAEEEARRRAEEARRNPFKNANIGDIVKFGNYPQTSNGDIQPIEWQILSIENNKMLVISRYGLDAKPFDQSWNNWSNSEIRNWLNGEFYNKAFTDQEKKSINLSNLSDVGTTDNVFLLSYDEAEKYFANNELRKCKATEYAVKNGVYVSDNGYSSWRLRSPDLYSDDDVYDVDYDGDFGSHYYVYSSNLVTRPALWINL